MSSDTNHVSLTPEDAAVVRQLVESGRYQSADDVISAGLRVLSEQEAEREAQLTRFRETVEIGYQQTESGQMVDGPAAVQRVKVHLNRKRAGLES